MSDSNIPSQDNCPDTRSNSDQQHSLQIDQASPDILNTSSTDIQVHPSPVSGIDPKTIRAGGQSPATETGDPPIGTSPEAQEQPSVVQHPENPPGYRLLDAMWRSPDRHHQLGTLDRQNDRFKNLPVKDAADALAQALKLSSEGTEVYFACAEYLASGSRVVLALKRLPMASVTALSPSSSTILAGIARHIRSFQLIVLSLKLLPRRSPPVRELSRHRWQGSLY